MNFPAPTVVFPVAGVTGGRPRKEAGSQTARSVERVSTYYYKEGGEECPVSRERGKFNPFFRSHRERGRGTSHSKRSAPTPCLGHAGEGCRLRAFVCFVGVALCRNDAEEKRKYWCSRAETMPEKMRKRRHSSSFLRGCRERVAVLLGAIGFLAVGGWRCCLG